MPKPMPKELQEMQKRIESVARKQGLDLFETVYEVLDYDEVNMVASYSGFPVRYPHWKWGMEYERLKKSYEYGLSKIYEMVINNDPCYAYLLESNSYIDQKIVICHVTGHNDFFKNNFAFAHTNRKMINEMANHASKMRRYMDWFGVTEVETFIDRVLSLENLIDINLPYIVRSSASDDLDESERRGNDNGVRRIPAKKEYLDSFINPDVYLRKQEKIAADNKKKSQAFMKNPKRDVLGFLMEHAPLNRWQADVIDMIREEAYYFVPQAMTKIMNEGWATFWHAKLMTESVMEQSELIDFADRHSAVVANSGQGLNPYKLGLELYRDIEERWNKGQFGAEWEACDDMQQKRCWDTNKRKGMEKLFQVRKIYNDLTFIDEFLTIDFCKRVGLFTYGFDKRKQEFVIESRDFAAVKSKLLASLTNLGNPQIQVVNANFDNRGELLLEHVYDGVELDLTFARHTLANLAVVWRRPVHIYTKVDDRDLLLSHDGENYKESVLARQV